MAGVKDRETNQVRTKVVDRADKRTLQDFVISNTEANATVYTDEASAYVGIPRAHESVAHSAGEYVRLMAHTNGMESHWSMFKRGIVGVCHHITVKHLHCYSTEFAGRHNRRPMDTAAQMSLMVRKAYGKRLTYAALIGNPIPRI